MSLNIFHGEWIEKVVEFVKDNRIDILMLQEVTNGVTNNPLYKSDNFKLLKNKLNMHGVYAPGWRLEPGETPFELGVAILSKFPIRTWSNFFYLRSLTTDKPDNEKNFPGLALNTEIEIQKKSFRFISTHFPWSLYPQVTNDQMEASKNLIAYLNQFVGFVLAGDFNLTEESSVYQNLIKYMENDRPERLETSLNPDLHRVKGIKLAVDFVFHKNQGLTKIASEVPMVPLSDHLPVIVDYELSI